jgi:lysophospholipase L1-like esterase
LWLDQKRQPKRPRDGLSVPAGFSSLQRAAPTTTLTHEFATAFGVWLHLSGLGSFKLAAENEPDCRPTSQRHQNGAETRKSMRAIAVVTIVLITYCAHAFDGKTVQSASLVATGDLSRVWQVMAKAQRGEKVVVAVIGGSITQGAKASKAENRYGNLVANWWRQAFRNAQIVFINAGIGATGSDFGALRAQRDLLAHRPDFVVVEYGVNDGNSQACAETLEGLIRQILRQPNQPAVVQLFMLHRNGGNAQPWQSKVGAHYHLPMISYRDALWPEIQAGRVTWDTVMADDVHPNDLGHACAAEFVSYLLEKAKKGIANPAVIRSLPAPLFGDLHEHTALFEAPDLKPLRNKGWRLDEKSKSWVSDQPGSVIEFEINGRAIFSMHFVVKRGMGKARFQVDGGKPVVHDGWFNQTWGGYRSTQLLAKDLPPGRHTVRVELLEEKNSGSEGHEFRLFGLGAAGVE